MLFTSQTMSGKAKRLIIT